VANNQRILTAVASAKKAMAELQAAMDELIAEANTAYIGLNSIVVEVEGGCVQEVYAQGTPIEHTVNDLDVAAELD